ncbi:hypothetical protein OG474_09595 [Kribbella sp. NBC_01505]|uniref:phage terminase small subunit n=1 Tax=Kribbella sp. NBC_01505 TaxID=2903580 RepID=UPI0038680713
MARGTLNPKKPNSVNRNNSGLGAHNHVLTADGVTRGPSLEEATGRTWDDDVNRWYDVWRNSAQAQIFQPTDWARLALLAPLVEKHFASPTGATMSEIRLNEERLGATVVDRLRARISIGDGIDATILSLVDEEDDDDILGQLS